MKFIEKCQYIIALSAAACSGSVTANTVTDFMNGTPTGPYTSTCSNITWSTDTRILTATCQFGGRSIQSSLHLPIPPAPNSIINCNGFLSAYADSCTATETITIGLKTYTATSPRGPYIDSCSTFIWDSKKRVLTAICPTGQIIDGLGVDALSTLSLPLQTGQTDPIDGVTNCGGKLKWLPNYQTC